MTEVVVARVQKRVPSGRSVTEWALFSRTGQPAGADLPVTHAPRLCRAVPPSPPSPLPPPCYEDRSSLTSSPGHARVEGFASCVAIAKPRF
eukprot:365043-Chlamydomonas_euryale.AAC.24